MNDDGIVVLQLARNVSALAKAKLTAATHAVVQVAAEADLDVANPAHHAEIVDLSAKILSIDPYADRARR
jgi:hypothetical protein